MSLPYESRRPRAASAAAWHRRSAGGGPATPSRQSEADLAQVAHGLETDFPDAYPSALGYGLAVSPLRREFTREFESTLLILVGTAGFVLLIVCASVANLAVARTMRRDRELALRTALGASQGRLLRQLVTESLILSLAGGAGGLLLAFVGMDLLVQYAGRFTPRATEVGINTTVLLFTLVVSLLTGIIAAILPAVSRRLGPRRAAISAGSRGIVHRSDLRRALIVAQVAASFMLLIGAGLMVRSLLKLTGVNPGFSTDHVLTMQIDMNFTKYRTPAERAAYLDRLLANLQAIPGVTAVGATGTIPLLEEAGGSIGALLIAGRDADGQDSENVANGPRASLMIASDDYFRAMDIPLVDGRFFAAVRQLRCIAGGRRQSGLCRQQLARGERGRATDLGQRRPDVAHRRRRRGQRPPAAGARTGRRGVCTHAAGAIRDDELGDPLARRSRQCSCHSCRRPCEQPTATSRSIACGRSTTCARLRSRRRASRRRCWGSSRRWRSSSPRPASPASSRIRSASAHRSSACASRSAPAGPMSSRWWLARVSGWRWQDCRLALLGAVVLGALLSTVLFGVGPVDAVTYVAVSAVLLGVAALACLLPALRAASIDPMTALRAG